MMSGPGMGGGGEAAPHKIVLRSTTDTELLLTSVIGAGVDRGPRIVTTRVMKSTSRAHTTRTRAAKKH